MKAFALTFLFLAVSTALSAQTINDLAFITEEYPPFNYTEEKTMKGISVDTLDEMLKMAGSSKSRNDIGSLTWARGYSIAQNKKNTLFFSMARTEAREDLFKWVGPILQSEIVLIAKKGRNIQIDSIAEINKSDYRVGAVLKDVGELSLLELGVNKERIFRFFNGVYLLQMLYLDKIDLMAYGRTVTAWNIKNLGYNPDDYQIVYRLKSVDYYYALNKQTDDDIVAQLQYALDQIKESGEFDLILKHYLPDAL